MSCIDPLRAVLLLGATAAFLIYLKQALERYSKLQIGTEVIPEQQTFFRFPAVTICGFINEEDGDLELKSPVLLWAKQSLRKEGAELMWKLCFQIL